MFTHVSKYEEYSVLELERPCNVKLEKRQNMLF